MKATTVAWCLLVLLAVSNTVSEARKFNEGGATDVDSLLQANEPPGVPFEHSCRSTSGRRLLNNDDAGEMLGDDEAAGRHLLDSDKAAQAVDNDETVSRQLQAKGCKGCKYQRYY